MGLAKAEDIAAESAAQLQRLENESQSKVAERENVAMSTEMSVDVSEVSALREQIDKLRSELAASQRTIIEMTSVVGVQQSFPTVQETMQQYRSIRDQHHHDTSTVLKRCIKRTVEGAEKWQKYFISQSVHRIMFDTLQKCYARTVHYRKELFAHIGDSVNMPAAIASALQLDVNNSEDVQVIAAEQQKLLSNIFGAYFKNNFKFVLDRRLERPLRNVASPKAVESVESVELAQSDEKSCETVESEGLVDEV